jgi:hypothetical protein
LPCCQWSCCSHERSTGTTSALARLTRERLDLLINQMVVLMSQPDAEPGLVGMDSASACYGNGKCRTCDTNGRLRPRSHE